MAYTTIDDPSEFFQTKLYTGTGSSLALTNDGNSDLQPDWVWAKRRDGTYSHALFDSSRGSTKRLVSNLSNAEDTNAQYITSFDSDGFTSGTDANLNQSSLTYVAWQWKANGGTTTTNDASATSVGTIDSVIQANTTAGFSIVTYTGTGSNGTIAHGLGATPQMYWVKRRSADEHWQVYSEKIGNTKYFQITTDGEITGSNRWNNTSPTSSVFSVGDHASVNGSSDTYVAYCFTDIKGYSKFGSYTGNGNADGAFVYTGFKPAWLLVKRFDANGNSWYLFDSARNEVNVVDNILRPNIANAELTDDTGTNLDFVSNGFKTRTTSADTNNNGGTYIYMAFAEHPFVSSKGVPTTAR